MAENASDPTAPVSDDGVLTTLAEEPGRDLVLNFAARWSQLLPRRIERIREASNARDVHAGIDAVLSLKVSSSAVGAQQLAGIVASLEREVRHQDWTAAERHAVHLPDPTTVAALELNRILDRQPDEHVVLESTEHNRVTDYDTLLVALERHRQYHLALNRGPFKPGSREPGTTGSPGLACADRVGTGPLRLLSLNERACAL